MKCDACGSANAGFKIVPINAGEAMGHVCLGCVLLLLPNRVNPMSDGQSPGEEPMKNGAS